jgi:5-methylcytosine-specific restriction protein B
MESSILKDLNARIADRNYEVGISFFLSGELAENLEDIWRLEVEPYVEEYLFDDPAKVDSFRWDEIRQKVLP